MEYPLPSTLVMGEAEVLLQILVVALDAPVMMGDTDECFDGDFLE